MFKKELLALGSHVEAVIARERCRSDTDPDDDGCKRLFDISDADKIDASPLHLHRVQDVEEFEGKAAFPDLLNGCRRGGAP